VSWPYHEAPVDCWRAYPEGIKALFEDSGFSIIVSKCECLELEYFNYSNALLKIPNFTIGNSSFVDDNYKLATTNKLKIIYNNFLKNIPLVRRMMVPVKVAYDTISIVKKQ